MKGASLLETLYQLGIPPSRSRPRVSNDNPYAESIFRTCALKSAVLGLFGLVSFGLLTAALITSVWGILLVLVIVVSKPILTFIGSLMVIAMLNLPIIGVLWGIVGIALALGSSVQLLFQKDSKGNQ